MIGSNDGEGGPPPLPDFRRPWYAEAPRSLRFGISLHTTAVGWSVFETVSTPARDGAIGLGQGLTRKQRIAALVNAYRSMAAEAQAAGKEVDRAVEIYRYSAQAFPRSVPAAEGMAHEEHEALIREGADALRAAGAEVMFKEIR